MDEEDTFQMDDSSDNGFGLGYGFGFGAKSRSKKTKKTRKTKKRSTKGGKTTFVALDKSYKVKGKQVYIKVILSKQDVANKKYPIYSATQFKRIAKGSSGCFYVKSTGRTSRRKSRRKSGVSFGCGSNGCSRFGQLTETYSIQAPYTAAPVPPAAHFGGYDTNRISSTYAKFGSANFPNSNLFRADITQTPTTVKVNTAKAAFGEMMHDKNKFGCNRFSFGLPYGARY